MTYANYSYNAWSEPVRVYLDNGSEITAADNIANLNPIRYRGYYYDTETGFYYLQSRYYDPVLCRFVNADSQLDSDSFLGYNLFAYCANNPVNNSDPDGHGFWKSVVKRVKKAVKKVVKATMNYVKRKVTKYIVLTGGKTRSWGLSLSGSLALSGSISAGITMDGHGNIGVIRTVGGGGGMPSWSFSAYESVTNAPDIYEQRGLGVQTGGSLNAFGIGGGIDTSFSKNEKTGQNYYAVTMSFGLKGSVIPIEMHGQITKTAVYGFNIFEELDKIYAKVEAW